MPEFQYRAVDAQGRDVQGALSAPNANAAIQSLGGQGLRVRQISEGATVGPAQRQAAQKIKVPAHATAQPLPKKRTSASTNGELFFLFAQLSNLFRGGVAPSEALVTLSQRNHNRKYARPLVDMAAMTTEGRSLSEALETYPDLFPPGVVGAVRAGERGGYLSEACGVVSEQCKETHKLQRLFWWVGIAVIVVAVSLAMASAGSVGVDRAIASINDPQNPQNAMVEGLREAFLGITGWSLAAFFVLYFFIKVSLRKTARRPQRHALALRTPIVGKRARAESLALFSWHLNRLGNAGLSPFQAWGLAAAAVPNLAFAHKLEKVGSGMNESTNFSALFYKSDLFPHEIAAVIETGEMTGSIASSLEQAMDYSRADQRAADAALKAKAGCWMFLLIGGGGMIAFMILYGGYLKSATKQLDPFVGNGMGEQQEQVQD